ncbi:MAG: hypothetical protein DRI95_00565 [Bacteroidetes bacterium]|nr:MAG: hypothetical protein DRI95_00565 [Bacteroidota bacterium]
MSKVTYISKIDKIFSVKGKLVKVKKGEKVDTDFVMLFSEGKSRNSRFEIAPEKKEVSKKEIKK